jgi:hypothetical protein
MMGLNASICFFSVLALGFIPGRTVFAQDFPSAEQLVSNVLARTQTIAATRPKENYHHRRLSVSEELDGKGMVQSRTEKLLEVTYHGEKPQFRLIKLNGVDMSGSETNRLNDRAPKKAPVHKSGSQRMGFAMSEELLARYHFTVEKREIMKGRTTYRVRFEPASRDLPVRQLTDRLLNKLHGTVWLDAEEFEIRQLQVALVEKTSLWGGLLGTMDKFDLSLTRVRLADGTWFNETSRFYIEARKLFESIKMKTEETSSDFERISVLRGRISP